jgi:hypothetical protein
MTGTTTFLDEVRLAAGHGVSKPESWVQSEEVQVLEVCVLSDTKGTHFTGNFVLGDEGVDLRNLFLSMCFIIFEQAEIIFNFIQRILSVLRWMTWTLNWKKCRMVQISSNLTYCTEISLAGLRKNTTSLCQEIRCPARDFQPGTFEFEARVLLRNSRWIVSWPVRFYFGKGVWRECAPCSLTLNRLFPFIPRILSAIMHVNHLVMLCFFTPALSFCSN